VTDPCPYTPPTAEVRDVPPSAHEKRLLRNLVRFLDHESARLARNRAFGWAGWFGGVICIGVAASMQDPAGSGFFWALLAGVGGVVTGLSIVFRSTARNWPILRRYFDVERLRADYEKVRDR